MLSFPSARWFIISLLSVFPFSHSRHLPSVPARLTSSLKPPSGPPTAPSPPYPIPNTHPPLVLTLQKPRSSDPPVALSRAATTDMLKSAKAQLDHEIKQHGSAHDIGYGLVVIEDEVQIFFNSGHDFTLGDGSAAMRGILTMITSGLLETNEMTLDLTEGEDEKYLGSLVISKQISKQRIGEPQTRLDPKNYHIPNSHVTVSLKGDPPFGAPLPGRSTLLALNAGIAAARSVMRSQGDDAVMPFGWWNVEAGVIGIDIHTQVHIDCLFSTLATGLRGLMDLMSEQGGIGTVAAEFDFIEEDQGVVATGWLKILANAVEKAAGTPMIKSNRTLSVA